MATASPNGLELAQTRRLNFSSTSRVFKSLEMIAASRPAPTTWQEVAREAIDIYVSLHHLNRALPPDVLSALREISPKPG